MSEEAVMESAESLDTTTETTDTSAASAPEASTPEAAAPAAQPQQSVWDAFKALPDFKGADDVSIARRLYASMEREKAATQALAQYQQYIPYAQQYLQNRDQFEAWQASQRQQQQPVAPPPAPPPASTTGCSRSATRPWATWPRRSRTCWVVD